ncbi:MAG: hypothetical protein U5L08_12155 [Xanthomonadales bacterium]|nr:hypothetical protein [Xanthomonadales bacterium]
MKSDKFTAKRANTALKVLAGCVSGCGVLLALFALGLALWETLGRLGEIPAYFIVHEWVATPTMPLLLFTIIWIERLVTLYRSGHSKLVRLGYSKPTVQLIGRGYQWLAFVASWISSTIALHRLTELGTTAAMITTALTFGLSMWLLEGLSVRQAFEDRDPECERAHDNEPIGC